MLSAKKTEQQTSFQTITNIPLGISSADESDYLNTAWEAILNMKSDPTPCLARLKMNGTDTEEKVSLKTIKDPKTGDGFVNLLRRLVGDLYLGMAMVLVVSIVIYEKLWSK